MSICCTLEEAMTLISWHRSEFFVPPEFYFSIKQSLIEAITPWGDELQILDTQGEGNKYPGSFIKAAKERGASRAHLVGCGDRTQGQSEFLKRHGNLFRFKLQRARLGEVQPGGCQRSEDRWSWSDALNELRDFKSAGFEICLFDQDNFPRKLKALRYPPWALSYRGSLEVLDKPTLAVVGAREMSGVTQIWLETELQDFLSKTAVVSVSGGARGVDQAVHWQSLKLGLPTVMVLPSGLKRVYPQNMTPWMEPIVRSGGLILSEFPPHLRMRKWHFFLRNRLIAALGDRVLIAQAQKKSGSWSTAQWALEEGRELLALASFPGATAFSGNIHLIKSGVPPIFDHQDLMHHFALMSEEKAVLDK